MCADMNATAEKSKRWLEKLRRDTTVYMCEVYDSKKMLVEAQTVRKTRFVNSLAVLIKNHARPLDILDDLMTARETLLEARDMLVRIHPEVELVRDGNLSTTLYRGLKDTVKNDVIQNMAFWDTTAKLTFPAAVIGNKDLRLKMKTMLDLTIDLLQRNIWCYRRMRDAGCGWSRTKQQVTHAAITHIEKAVLNMIAALQMESIVGNLENDDRRMPIYAHIERYWLVSEKGVRMRQVIEGGLPKFNGDMWIKMMHTRHMFQDQAIILKWADVRVSLVSIFKDVFF